MNAPRKLGKGLSALMAEDYSQHTTDSNELVTEGNVSKLTLDVIRSGKFQPRMHFDERYLRELADSISKSGIMQPIVVRPIEANGEVKYEIIAGERRWRAAKLAGERTVPALIREISDQQALELALIENVQRQDLTPLEEARGYQRLMDEFSYTQEELAKTVGKSRSHIANLLRMLNLPQKVKEMLERGELTMGHARALMKADKPEKLAQEVVRRGLNVRQTENLTRSGVPEKTPSKKPTRSSANPAPVAEHYSADKSPDILSLEETLAENTGLKVEIEDSGETGKVVLHYNSLGDLDTILQRLGGGF